MTARTPKPPAHLQPATKRWWASVVSEFELEAHHVRLLTLAAEAFDRCQQARETIATEGPIFQDRFGQPKAHPSVGIERDSKIAFARLLRELDLDGGPDPDPRIPRPGGR
ncbi:MAG: P27 family phage terminase small subunit [Gammaproteobacteria bacterium]